jgi:glycosyltransferase involved in cell wall biosynthesis
MRERRLAVPCGKRKLFFGAMETMLQIIHASTNGGAEKHTRLISKAFKRLGFNVLLVYPPGPYAPSFKELEKLGVHCIEYDLKRNVFKTFFFVRRLIRENNVKYIHSHMHGADIVATVARIGIRGIRHFSTIHFLPQDNTQLLYRLRSSLMAFLSFQLMDKVFAVSTDVSDVARAFFFLPRSKIAVTLNSIDFGEMIVDPANAAVLHSRFKSRPQDRLILSAGTFVERKGQRYIIEALRDLDTAGKSVKLALLGEGEKEKELKALVHSMNLDNIVLFPGYQSNIVDWFSIADVYVQASLIDPLPRALLEAMYMGVPVIATSLRTISEVIKDGETGLTVPAASPFEIRWAMEFMLGNDEKARAMGRTAREFVINNCSMTTMAQKTLACLGIAEQD